MTIVSTSRQPGQGTVAEQRGRDYRKELEERERTAREKRERGRTHGMEQLYIHI